MSDECDHVMTNDTFTLDFGEDISTFAVVKERQMYSPTSCAERTNIKCNWHNLFYYSFPYLPYLIRSTFNIIYDYIVLTYLYPIQKRCHKKHNTSATGVCGSKN